MKRISLIISILLPLMAAYADNSAPEHVVWNRVPIRFIVPVGQERMLTFPSAVDFHNTNPNLTSDKLAVMNNNGTLYIKAKQQFAPIRVPVIVKSSGEVVLVDVGAQPGADDTPLQVVLADQQQKSKADNSPQQSTVTINYVTLMRYAIQHLFAPRRIVKDLPEISRTPMFTSKSVDLVYGSNVIAMPLISWRGGDLYVTAVELKNVWPYRIHLDPRSLRGRWLADSFYPTNYLAPRGQLHDRTTLLVISDRPFNQALTLSRGYV